MSLPSLFFFLVLYFLPFPSQTKFVSLIRMDVVPIKHSFFERPCSYLFEMNVFFLAANLKNFYWRIMQCCIMIIWYPCEVEEIYRITASY